MTELLAVLVSLYVLYALYAIYKTISQSDSVASTATAETTAVTPPPPAVEPLPAKPASAPAEAAAKPAPASVAAPAEPAKIVDLRNPLTGEVSPVPGNYRFAKKWIKEAMVTEGLLNKVYKNSELNEAVNPKVKAAIEEFKRLEKYHA